MICITRIALFYWKKPAAEPGALLAFVCFMTGDTNLSIGRTAIRAGCSAEQARGSQAGLLVNSTYPGPGDHFS